MRHITIWTLLMLLLSGASFAGEEAQPVFKLAPISEVQLGGEIGRRIDLTIQGNLLQLDLAPGGLFLGPFQKQTWPQDMGDYGGYVGLGKTMDALVRFTAYSGDPKVLALKDSVFQTLLATQTEDGYMGAFAPEARVTSAFDLHEMVYIMQALADDYRYFDSHESLEAARRLADFIMRAKPAEWIFENINDVRKLSIERAFLAVADTTGEAKYREYGVATMDLRNWQPPVEGHCYWFFNRCVAQVDLYRVEGNPKLLEESHKAIDFLMANDAQVITGACSLGEYFHTSQEGRGNLGESCAVAYLIRLCHQLLQVEGNSIYGDIMERAILNSLFAAQSADGRRLRYYTCFEGPRAYMNTDTYCCPGNWRRIVSELPEMIYYVQDGGFMVNLYTASSAQLKLGKKLSAAVRQETDYPNSGNVTLHVEPSKKAAFAVQLRIPRWCGKPQASVNGKPIEGVTPGTFLTIKRQWEKGDRVELSLPMETRLIQGRNAQSGKAAVMRGPVVFCLGNQDKSSNELSHLRARIAEVDAELGGLSGSPVNLADIAGGGGGFGAGRTGCGIDARSGNVVGGMYGQVWWHTANEFKASESPFVDGIVVPNGSRGPVPISATGLTIEGVPATCGMAIGYAMDGPKNASHWTPADGPEYAATISPMCALPQPYCNTCVGGVEYSEPGHSMLGLEANKALTFDLAAIRKATGYQKLTFQSIIGYCAKADPTVDVAIYTDGKAALERTALTREPLPVSIQLDTAARFLTLMVTDQNQTTFDHDIIPSDAVIFGDPMLVPQDAATSDGAAAKRAHLEKEMASLKEQYQRYIEPLDAARDIVIDGASVEGPFPDTTVRPGGMALHVKGWSPGRDTAQPPNLALILSEFPDPEGRATYFKVKTLASAVEDDLISSK